jgi:hypothetical protein
MLKSRKTVRVLVRYGSRLKIMENDQKSTVRCAVDLNGPSWKTVRTRYTDKFGSPSVSYNIHALNIGYHNLNAGVHGLRIIGKFRSLF